MLDKDEAAAKHAAMDGDKSGRIEKNEFMKFMATELTTADSQEDVVEAFTQLAGGNDGGITEEQLQQHFKDELLLGYLREAMPLSADGSAFDFTKFCDQIYETSAASANIPDTLGGGGKARAKSTRGRLATVGGEGMNGRGVQLLLSLSPAIHALSNSARTR